MSRPLGRHAGGRRCPLVVVVALVVSVGAVGCRHQSASVAGRLTVTAGRAEVGRPGEERAEVTGSRDLRIGDGVRIRTGAAAVSLAGDRDLELRSGTDLELRAATADERARTVLVSGDLLVRSPQQPLTVTSGDEEVMVSGTARISRGLALVVATYDGSATVSSAARSIIVPALRQVAVPAAGLFPVRPSPLDFSSEDGWDQRYLSGAIGLSAELLARSRGFSAQLAPTEGRTAAYFRSLVPRLAAEPAFQGSLVSGARVPGETLVGAAITLEGVNGSFADRWAAVFGFHDEGAPWGLVAMDQGVSRVPLLATIESAIGRTPPSFALAKPGADPTSLAPPTTRPSSAAAAVTTTSTTVAPSVRPTTPTTTPVVLAPTTVAPTGPLNTGTPLIDNTANALVNTLNGLLNSLGQR